MAYKAGKIVEAHYPRIGILEDNLIELQAITRLLEDNNYKSIHSSSGSRFLYILKKESFDLMILDWNVPDINGIEVLARVRNDMKISCPILILTSRFSEYDIVQALNSGADDYIQKPWKPFELLARINALLRRQRYLGSNNNIEVIADFTINHKAHEILLKEEKIKLSNKEFLLMQLLLKNIGSPISRTHIIQSVWNGEDPEARTIDVHITRLRNKLSLTADRGFKLISIYGFGYKLEQHAQL